MPDRIAALIEYLETYPALTGIPINAPRIKSGQAKLMPAECVVINQVGGFGNLVDALLYHQRVEIKAYGKTARSASALHDICMAAMFEMYDNYLKGVMLCTAELENGAVDDQETGTNQASGGSGNQTFVWPYTYSTWAVMTLNEETEGS